MRKLFALLARFGLAGLVNTAIGLSVIAALDLGLHVDPHIANAVGYAGGVATGYALNRLFVFKSRDDISTTGIKYLVAVGVAFLVNQGVLALAGPLFGPAPLGRLAAQVTAMVSYTVLTFVLCRLWVFRAPAARKNSEVDPGVVELALERTLRAYQTQKEREEARYREESGNYTVYLPELDLLRRHGVPMTWCTWAKGLTPYLPKADLIAFYIDGADDDPMVRWSDAEAAIGPFKLVEGSSPALYRPGAWPNAGQMKRLRQAALD